LPEEYVEVMAIEPTAPPSYYLALYRDGEWKDSGDSNILEGITHWMAIQPLLKE
jgi:hypothetical protein